MQDVATYINEIKRRRELSEHSFFYSKILLLFRFVSILFTISFFKVVKYSRKDVGQSSIGDKMAKLTIHSMIKKSNRISMKLSNAFGLNGVSVILFFDYKFDRLEFCKFYFVFKF